MKAENNSNQRNKVKISKDAALFANMTFKKYKKKEETGYESKKELKENYFIYLLDLFPDAIEFVVKFGYIQTQEVQETKHKIFEKLVSDDYAGFVKVLRKAIKHGDKIDNIKLLPIAIREILTDADKQNKELLSKDPNAKLYDMSDLVELSKLVLKKRLKKMEKSGIDPAIAFDVLSVIPVEKCLERSQNYRIHMFYETLYEHSKTKTIQFAELMNNIVSEDYYLLFIVFALLERKEKFANLIDPQKNFYLQVTDWCFKTLEGFRKEDIYNAIRVYINGRKRDESRGKDTNRRYSILSLPAEDYPKITKVVQKMVTDDDSIKKYL